MIANRLFERIEAFALRRYTIVFAAAAILVILSAWCASLLRLDTDIMSMVPKHNPTVEVFKRSLRDFGSLDYFLILISTPDENASVKGATSAEDYEEFADDLAGRLQNLDSIDYVEYRLDETSPIFTNLSENALIFLGPARLDKVRPLFTDEAIARKVAELRESFQSQPSFLVKLQAKIDPLGLLPSLYGSFLQKRGAFKIDLLDGYYLSADHKSLLIIAKPKRPPQDVTFSQTLYEQVQAAKQAALEKLREGRESSEADPLAGMTVEYGGGYMIAVEDSK